MIIWGEFSSSLHCVINPVIYFYTNRTFRKFLLRPFRGTFFEKTKLFAKYNAANGIYSQNLQVSKAKILAQKPPRQESARPFSYPRSNSDSSELPTVPSTTINTLSQISENTVVKSPEPITRSIMPPTSSSVTDNTVLSEFSVVSHDADPDYEGFWAVNDGSFELRMNTM